MVSAVPLHPNSVLSLPNMTRIIKRMKFSLLALLSVTLLLTGCSGEQTGDVTPATATSAATSPAETVLTPVVPGLPVGLCTGDCVVIDFQVWQDFMPSRSANSALLHSTLTLEIEWPQQITQDIAQGTITLVRAGGRQVVTADLQLSQPGVWTGQSQPSPQQVVFIMVPQSLSIQLTEGEMLQGAVTLTLGGKARTIDLPEAALLFTH